MTLQISIRLCDFSVIPVGLKVTCTDTLKKRESFFVFCLFLDPYLFRLIIIHSLKPRTRSFTRCLNLKLNLRFLRKFKSLSRTLTFYVQKTKIAGQGPHHYRHYIISTTL